MPQGPSPKRVLPQRAKRARKAASRRETGQPALPPPWATALARVKRHIQSESRLHIQAG
jgi:hypothetical protein